MAFVDSNPQGDLVYWPAPEAQCRLANIHNLTTDDNDWSPFDAQSTLTEVGQHTETLANIPPTLGNRGGVADYVQMTRSGTHRSVIGVESRPPTVGGRLADWRTDFDDQRNGGNGSA